MIYFDLKKIVIECAEEKIDNIIWLGESKRNHNDKQVGQLRQSNQDMRSSNQRINKQRKSNHYNKAHDDSNLFDYFQENINIPLLVGQDYSKYSIRSKKNRLFFIYLNLNFKFAVMTQ